MNNLYNCWGLHPLHTRTYIKLCDLFENGEHPTFAEDKQLEWKDLLNNISLTGISDPETIELFQKYVYPEFWNEFILYLDDMDETTDIKQETEFEAWSGRVIRWLRATAPKYTVLLKLYKDQEAHLMDQVKTSTSSVNTNNGKSDSNSSNANTNTSNNVSTNTNNAESHVVSNDTPQIAAGLDSDEYASNVTKSNGSNKDSSTSNSSDENSGTAESHSTSEGTSLTDTVIGMDKETVIKRLMEVRDNLENLYDAWSREFRQFVLYL